MIDWLKSWRPNQEQVAAAVRWLIVVIGTGAVSKGWVDDDQLTMIAGIGAALVPLVWSFVIKTHAMQAQGAAALDDVTVIVGPKAQPSLRELARDPSVPNIEVK